MWSPPTKAGAFEFDFGGSDLAEAASASAERISLVSGDVDRERTQGAAWQRGHDGGGEEDDEVGVPSPEPLSLSASHEERGRERARAAAAAAAAAVAIPAEANERGEEEEVEVAIVVASGVSIDASHRRPSRACLASRAPEQSAVVSRHRSDDARRKREAARRMAERGSEQKKKAALRVRTKKFRSLLFASSAHFSSIPIKKSPKETSNHASQPLPARPGALRAPRAGRHGLRSAPQQQERGGRDEARCRSRARAARRKGRRRRAGEKGRRPRLHPRLRQQVRRRKLRGLHPHRLEL